MSTNFREALDEEISELEAALAQDPRFRKLTQLRELRNLYTAVPDGRAGMRAQGTGVIILTEGTVTRGPAPNPNAAGLREKLLQDIAGILTGRTEPTSTSDIYDAVVHLGHYVGGADPKNNLSAMLSRSPQFQSHGRQGWTLRASEDEKPNSHEPIGDEDDDL